MNHEEFAEVFSKQIAICEDLLVTKGKEYAGGGDRLHNFKVAAATQGVTVKQALAGMMAKHTVSLYDMIRSDKLYDLDIWDEKITDHMNYLILLKAAVCEDYLDEAQERLHLDIHPPRKHA